MLSYTHLTLNERKYLQELLDQGYTVRGAADVLERSPSTISREIKRNKSKYPHKPSSNRYNYNHWRAQNLYTQRRRKHERCRLKEGTPEWDYIIAALNRFWSPEQIVKRWRLEHPGAKVFGSSTIYRYIKKKRFPSISRKSHLRRRGKRMLPRSSNYNSIQPDRIIPEWPEDIQLRKRIGDWEGDTVYGGIGKGCVVTQVDRKSRFLRAGLLLCREAQSTSQVIIDILKGLPVSSISLDNGSEFADFKRIESELETLVYFAEPHKPWQRGTNENTNDILRFFFPKGFDFRSISQAELDYIVSLINLRPRKCLGFLSPFEVFFNCRVALA